MTPLALLVLMVLSFGLMFPWLGLYWDDWPIVLAARLQGVEAFWDYYRYERPFSAWTYILTIPILGTRPIVWHIFTLLLRWLTVVAMWWSLTLLWPKRRRQAVWIVMLFAIYPIFTNQPVAVTFNQQWVCYALYFFSIGAMLQSIRTPRRSLLLNSLGVAATLLNMLTMEYTWGLELLRPVLLWIIYGEYYSDRSSRLRAIFKTWVPYLLTFVLVVGWRLLFAEQLRQGNKPELLYSLGSTPIGTALQLLQIGLQDTINNLAGAWYTTIDPVELDLADRSVLASLAVALLTFALTFYFLLRFDKAEVENHSPRDDNQWVRQAILIGLLGAFLGPLPVWLIDRQSLFGLHSGRFALAAMSYLSIFIVGLLEWFNPRRLPKVALLAILIGLAAGFHLRNSVSYYRSTLMQNQFYWQLYWRAPYIQPGTALLSADELFPFVGRNPTAVTLNLLYPQPYGSRQVGYWFLELYHDVGSKVVPKLPRGRTLNANFRTFDFTGSSLDSLVIFYKPGAGRCLWVLSPEDADNPEVPELTRLALPVSNLGRIQSEPISGGYPPTDLFGDEPPHTWCYYYQKAELARQFDDWQAVAQLGDQAQEQGYTPMNANEWSPFIAGYAYIGKWKQALERTMDAYDLNNDIAPRLCTLWGHIQTETSPPAGVNANLEQMRTQLQCVD